MWSSPRRKEPGKLAPTALRGVRGHGSYSTARSQGLRFSGTGCPDGPGGAREAMSEGTSYGRHRGEPEDALLTEPREAEKGDSGGTARSGGLLLVGPARSREMWLARHPRGAGGCGWHGTAWGRGMWLGRHCVGPGDVVGTALRGARGCGSHGAARFRGGWRYDGAARSEGMGFSAEPRGVGWMCWQGTVRSREGWLRRSREEPGIWL
jgi:hypothetical protein